LTRDDAPPLHLPSAGGSRSSSESAGQGQRTIATDLGSVSEPRYSATHDDSGAPTSGGGRTIAGQGSGPGCPSQRWFPVCSLLSLSVAALALTYMHLTLGDRVNPIRQTVSDYVRGRGGGGNAEFGRPEPCLCRTVPYWRLCAADTRRFRLVSVLLGGTVLGLVGVALFPTDPAASASTPAGELHRWSVTLSFVSVPCAGRLLARQLCGTIRRRVARLSTLSVDFLAVLMVSYVPVLFPGLPGAAVLSSPASQNACSSRST